MKTAEHIIETVDKLVRKYHTRDPYELCQLLGIKIHYYDLQKKLKGFFYYQSRQKNIVIDHNVSGLSLIHICPDLPSLHDLLSATPFQRRCLPDQVQYWWGKCQYSPR